MTFRKVDWWVGEITTLELRRIVLEQHYSKAYAGTGGYWHGLYKRGEWPWGHVYGACVWLAQVPLMRRFGRLPLVLSRLAIEPEVPSNGASFLIRHSMALIDRDRWPILVTYADEGQGHTGAIYEASGWTFDGIGGHVMYRHPGTGQLKASLASGEARFLPCPPGWEEVHTRKRRFIHAVAASSDAAVNQADEGSSQLTLPLQLETTSVPQ